MHKVNIRLMMLDATKHLWIARVYPTEKSRETRGTTKVLSTTHRENNRFTSITIEFYALITHRFTHIIHNPTHRIQSVIPDLSPQSTGLIIRTLN
jgi:hypothetical protein